MLLTKQFEGPDDIEAQLASVSADAIPGDPISLRLSVATDAPRALVRDSAPVAAASRSAFDAWAHPAQATQKRSLSITFSPRNVTLRARRPDLRPIALSLLLDADAAAHPSRLSVRESLH